jgi:uncharacterized cofD-like protein
VYLQPGDPPACEDAVHEIQRADIVVIGPGSLFTSVMPNLLVPGIRQALDDSRALKIYVCNIVTQPGQTDGFRGSDHLRATDGFRGSDHLRALLNVLGPAVLDYAVVNSHIPSEQIMQAYRAEGADIVDQDAPMEGLGVPIVQADLVENLDGQRVLWEKQDLLRHHPDHLADAVCRIYGDHVAAHGTQFA